MAARQRPNILFICTDQAYAHPQLPFGALPNHARLGSWGVTFENFQVTTPFCSPSRSVIYAGQHAPRTGLWDNLNYVWIHDLAPDIPTIGHMLRAAGYYTAYKGKWYLNKFATPEALERYGFADFQVGGEIWGAPLDGYKRDPEIVSEAACWLQTRAREIAQLAPWYLAVNLINPQDVTYFDTDGPEDGHTAGILQLLTAPADALYRERWPTQLPPSFDDDLSQQPEGVRAFASYIAGVYGFMPHNRPDLWHAHINYYCNCLRDMDQHLGTLLDALVGSGQTENTIIVFTSDHGEMGAAHGLRQKGGVAFKEVMNVPFIVCHPDGARGATTQAVGSSLDIVPTLLSYAGVPPAEQKRRYPQLEGHDLSGVIADPNSDGPRGSSRSPGMGALYTYDMLHSLDMAWLVQHAQQVADLGVVMETGFGPTPAEGEAILAQIEAPDLSRRGLFRGIWDGRYKLVRYFAPAHYNTPETLDEALLHNDFGLYDLAKDPAEVHNLAHPADPDHDPELLAHMNRKLTALIQTEIGQDQLLIRFSTNE